MSRAETARLLAASATQQRVQQISAAMDQMRRDAQELEATPAKIAQHLLPLAEAVAALTEESRRTMAALSQSMRMAHQQSLASVRRTAETVETTNKRLSGQLLRLESVAQQLEKAAQEAVIESQRSLVRLAIMVGALASLPTLAGLVGLAWKLGLLR